MRKISMVLAMAAVVLTAQAAMAEGTTAGQGRFAGRGGGAGGHHGQMLQALDKDGNGSVSKEEFVAGAADRFAKMDKNGDGVLTKDDMPDRGAGGGRRAHPGAEGGEGGDAPVPSVTTDAPPAE